MLPGHRSLLRALVAVTLVGAVACSGDDGGATTTDAPGPTGPAGTSAPQALTLQQAQLLASMRAANHRLVQASFQTSVEEQGDTVALHGVVDWEHHVGSAVFRAAGRTDANGNGLMQWNFAQVAAHPGGDVDGPPPAPPADGTWHQRPIDPATSTLDALFLVLLSVASPQPDNPQLLAQSDASYLGTEIVAGRTASVFNGPSTDDAVDPATASTTTPGAQRPKASSLTYWVADDGTLLRLEASLGGQVVTVEFAAAPTTPTAFLPDLLTAPAGG